MDKVINICKGLDINLLGKSEPILQEYSADMVALSPIDFKWLKPKLLVQEGDCVSIGTPLFCSKQDERVRFVSPVSGKVAHVQRGEKRKLESIVIENDHLANALPLPQTISDSCSRSEMVEVLLNSGLWNLIRQRPFGVIANPDDTPKSIFISTFDTAPLAPDSQFILENQKEEFAKGLEMIARLTNGTTYLSLRNGTDNRFFESIQGVDIHYFKGPHPAGNIGTQIHFLDPVKKGEVVWYVDLQDVVIIGRLFLRKELNFFKKIALCGSAVTNPAYFEMVIGSCIETLIAQNVPEEKVRIISGNVLSGRKIERNGYLGYYDSQISVIPELQNREVLGWLKPGLHVFSDSFTFLSKLFPHQKYAPNTALHGGHRALMMTDVYDEVFPFFILPNELLRACIVKDFDLMEALGIYEVVEEDFALCEVVCPSKTECQTIVGEALLALYNEIS